MPNLTAPQKRRKVLSEAAEMVEQMASWRELRAKEENRADGRILTDAEWAEEHLQIRIKPNLWTLEDLSKQAPSTIQPLRYSGIQTKLNQALDGMRTEEGRAMLIVLKARQMGVSTWIASRMFARATREAGIGCLMVGCDEENVNHLWSMHQLFAQYAPHPGTDYTNRNEITYSAPHHSHIAVQIAGPKTGTGRTLRLLHASEKAKWANVDATDTSLMQSAESADVVVESTANGRVGIGEPFAHDWDDAMAGRSDYFPLFFGWFDDDRYAIPEESLWYDRMMTTALSDEEGALIEKHGLALEQMAWRRFAIRNLCRNNEMTFKQEYPASPGEAFQKVEGTRVFSFEKCGLGQARSRPPLVTGRLRWQVEPKFDSDGVCANQEALRVRFVADENGPLKVWQMPSKTKVGPWEYRYLGSADVARGRSVRADKNCCPILDRQDRSIVARWTELCDASLFGTSTAMLAIWYGAQIAPELNDAGQSVLDKIHDICGVDYLWASYRFQAGNVYDEMTKDKYGWYTGHGNHETMVQALVDVVNRNPGTNLWDDPDEDFWTQAMGCIREPSGKAHITGLDLVSSACILAMMDRLTPYYYTEPEEVNRNDYGGSDWNPRLRRAREKAVPDVAYTGDYSGIKDWQLAGFPGANTTDDDLDDLDLDEDDDDFA
ncbi:MAG: hypothetical protein O3A47_08775 [Chloroflexi bacterium]|nr:hypothetical protein [Chloroflexota bacterium]